MVAVSDMIVTTDASVVDLLQDAMLTLARPIIAAMFVSKFNNYLLVQLIK